MPDISMCANFLCPMNQQCYRFKAEPSYYQSYADFKPFVNENEDMECNYFMEFKPIHKFNNGSGATLCHKCRIIITEGLTNNYYCDECQANKTPNK
jgi:hypothetical protein